MSQLFGFPSGLSGGSKETEYLTNWNTDRNTNYTTNWSISYNTSWTATGWSGDIVWTRGYAQFYTGTNQNDAALSMFADNQSWGTNLGSDGFVPYTVTKQQCLDFLPTFFSGVTLSGGLRARAGGQMTGWTAYGFNNYPNGYNESYYFYVQVYQSSSHSHNTSRGTSRSTSKITTFSTDETTSHITYG